MKDLGTLHAVGDRFMLRYERTYPHPVDRVWAIVSTADGLSRWFPARVELDALKVGAGMRFTFQAEDIERAREHGVEDFPLVSAGVVRELEPPRLFAFDWVDEPIRIELHETGHGCRLVFTHTFDRDPVQAPKNGAGWHVCLDALDAALDDREEPKGGPSHELVARYAARYAEVPLS
jgi:uncharacterized protein YndB with AHSA1/START domain